MVRQVTNVAVLLIVQGTFDVVAGLSLCGLALFASSGALPIAPVLVPDGTRAAIVVFGPLLTVAGALKIVAGVRNYQFRNPLLGIVALASLLVSAAICACAPTSVGLLAFGLATYRRPEVERAFQMGRQGLSREWIRASLDGGPRRS